MTRCIFCLPAVPAATNYSGGASRSFQNMSILAKLCEELHVVRMGTPAELDKIKEFEASSVQAQEMQDRVTGWQDISYLRKTIPGRTWRIVASVFDPVYFEFSSEHLVAGILEVALKRIHPDFIWVEYTELGAALTKLKPTIPWVLSHRDFLYRIRQIRSGDRRLRARWRNFATRRAEERVCRIAPYLVTHSVTEKLRLETAGSKSCFVIPVAHDEPYTVADRADIMEDEIRLVHLGSLETTANRLGLTAYLERIHSDVEAVFRMNRSRLQFFVIGDQTRVKPSLANLLAHHDAVLTGHVSDLSSILRPYDIAILPYEQDTGARTKLPLLMRYAQVVVSTEQAIAGTRIEGLEDACIIVKQLDDFPAAIKELVVSPAKRQELGVLARRFYLEHFTYDAVTPQYRSLLSQVLRKD